MNNSGEAPAYNFDYLIATLDSNIEYLIQTARTQDNTNKLSKLLAEKQQEIKGGKA